MHVIAAGSLLEFSMQNISFPVGRVQLLNMYPMNFCEFLVATGKKMAADVIYEHARPLPETVHTLLQHELRNYFLVGGMPEAVKTYTEKNSFADVFQIHSDLITAFRQDFSKYAGHADKRCLHSVLMSVHRNIGKQIKYARLDEDFSNPTIKKAFELLETARMFTKVVSARPEGIPLGSNLSEKTFKAVALDIGLLCHMNGMPVATEYKKQNLLAMFRGTLAEQFVGQELISAGHHELCYWSRQAKSSSAEIDYLIQKHNEIIPVEVKSGPSGRLKSLHVLFNNYPNIKKAFVFSDSQYGEIVDQKLMFLPLYFAYAACKIS